MMSTLAPALPEGDEWSYEVKWDGYRALLLKDDTGARLVSRNLKNLMSDYPHVAAAADSLTPQPVMLDGEIVTLDAEGIPTFQALQLRTAKPVAIVLCAFDLLHLGRADIDRRLCRCGAKH